MAHPEINFVLRLMDEGFDRKAWHGPNLCGSLRGISARQAAWRPAPGRHNIWELAVHAAYWKYAVRRRLLGGKRGSFAQKGSNWFPRPMERSEKAWRADLRLLEKEHRELRAAARSISASALHLHLANVRTRALDLLVGIAFHDVYHAAQIQLLKRLYRARRT